jgi:hypothetical protein
MMTQIDDAFLRRLVYELADIRNHIGLLRTLLGTIGVSLQAFDQQLQAVRETPEFQQACERLLRTLQGSDEGR